MTKPKKKTIKILIIALFSAALLYFILFPLRYYFLVEGYVFGIHGIWSE